MRWTKDAANSEWTATVTPEGQIRILQRTLEKPYREGEQPREEFKTYLFAPEEAIGLANTMLNAAAET